MKPDYTAFRMRGRNPALAVFALTVLQAGETVRKPADYPVHVDIGGITFAAENLGPSVPTPSGGLFTTDYLVIEVALFAEGAGRTVAVRHQHFALRINGEKSLLRPDSPGAVSASVKYPDWEQRRTIEAGVGPVIIGRPNPVGRFPGDNRGGRTYPQVENPVGRKGDNTPIDELVLNAALPEGEVRVPVTGCLYFPFKKKMKTIKKLELIYDGAMGEGSLRFP
jgi:hypothetical protein